MNLAVRDIRHNLGRFLLTCFGLSLLLGVVMSMIGIYRGLVAEALTLVRAPGVDLWVVEAQHARAVRRSLPPARRRARGRRAHRRRPEAGVGDLSIGRNRVRRPQAAALCHRLRARPSGRSAAPSREGRPIARSRFELVADRSHRPAGRRATAARARRIFEVVGLTAGAGLVGRRSGRLRHAAGFAEAAVRARAAGGATRAGARRRRGDAATSSTP